MEINRISYFDFLRGLAILMVIGIHTYIIKPFDGINNIFQIGLRECITFAVPLFLAISGFFLGKKRELNTKAGYFSFLKKQLPRVYVPALLWSMPVVALWIYQGQAIHAEHCDAGPICDKRARRPGRHRLHLGPAR